MASIAQLARGAVLKRCTRERPSGAGRKLDPSGLFAALKVHSLSDYREDL